MPEARIEKDLNCEDIRIKIWGCLGFVEFERWNMFETDWTKTHPEVDVVHLVRRVKGDTTEDV